jgi:hypothetical protein
MMYGWTTIAITRAESCESAWQLFELVDRPIPVFA